jgi:tripartite-type tricarboxylate transporter receptor subunit TctC
VDRLASATQKIMASPEMAARTRAGGAEPAASRPEEFQAQLRRETQFWQEAAKAMPHLVNK